MRMNRRNVLVGLGTIVAGGGAALGTGAFSSVEANRTVDVNVAGDSNALIGLSANESSPYVDDAGDELAIDLSQSTIENETNNSSTGVNTNAITTIENGFTVTNNGGKTVYIKIDKVEAGTTISFEANVDGGTSLHNQYVEVPAGESFDVDIEIDTDGSTGSISETATITAESTISGDAEATVSSP